MEEDWQAAREKLAGLLGLLTAVLLLVCAIPQALADEYDPLFPEQLEEGHLSATAAVLIEWQDTPLDMSCFYTGVSRGFGIFTAYGEITKVYCALKAFGIMTKYPHRLAITKDPAVYALAGENDEGEIAVLLSVFPIMGSNVTILLDFEPKDVRLYSVDIANNLDQVEVKFLGNSTVVPIGTRLITFQIADVGFFLRLTVPPFSATTTARLPDVGMSGSITGVVIFPPAALARIRSFP